MNARTAPAKFRLLKYRSPGTVIGRFVARRTMRSATVWALVWGAYVASKAVGYATAYPNTMARAKIAHSFTTNAGLRALLGQPHHIDTVTGFAAWNSLSILTIIGSIWAYLLATKYFRGEEDAGRREIILAGQTTARQAALNTLLGLTASLVTLFSVVAILFTAIGHRPQIGFGPASASYFALVAVSGAAMFMAVGALTSQLMPTRSRATTIATLVFGVSFLTRAVADVTNLHWLLNVTPLGWIERSQPLVGSQPIWLVPIVALTLVLSLLTIWLAGKRDLGDSVIADRDTAEPHTKLLNSYFSAGFRFSRANLFGWLAAIAVVGYFYGFLTTSATQAIAEAGGTQKAFHQLVASPVGNLSKLYLSLVFFILTPIIMAAGASAVSKLRQDEAEGYLDNFLVRPVSRGGWLGSRILLLVLNAVSLCLTAGLGVWLGQLNQHLGLNLGSFLSAGLNILAPVLLTTGLGLLAIGFMPRLTSVVAYGVIGWSFLIAMVSSGVNLNHWLLDTSVMHQLSLAPATAPNWHTNALMIIIAVIAGGLGAYRFNRRDLASA